jgi:hypothetical protein
VPGTPRVGLVRPRFRNPGLLGCRRHDAGWGFFKA